MNYKLAASLALALASTIASTAAVSADSSPKISGEKPVSSSTPHVDFCFFAGVPPSNVPYSRIKQLHLGKGTYGSARELLGAFTQKARLLGADAIINYSGAQHFGFWPWRMVRPVVKGEAIKWQEPKPECKAIGGLTLEDMESNKSPGT